MRDFPLYYKAIATKEAWWRLPIAWSRGSQTKFTQLHTPSDVYKVA
jgi:hypothetical protein